MKFISLLFSVLFSISLFAQSSIEEYLDQINDITYEEVTSLYPGYKTYELKIKQPIDHKNPSKGSFTQRAHLSHKGFNNLNVMVTEGYSIRRTNLSEPAYLLKANQIMVEHRYFDQSTPENKDWKYLTLEQATADLHKIRTLLGKIYQKDWVSTGISKGGQTTIAYRYFYPNDVQVSMPYVAPVNNSIEDKRIYKFLKKVGSKKCRKNILKYQKRLLKNKKDVLPLLKWYAKGAKLDFNYMNLEKAFEYGVLEYPFSFWQYGSNCETVPTKSASTEEMVEHFIKVVGISFYSDQEVDFYGPHYYQASTQLGYYGFETKKFKRYLSELKGNPNASFPPVKNAKYNPSYNDKLSKWLKNKADNMIYIYGKNDTWSATMVPISKKVNSQWFILEGRSHSDANINNLNAEEKQRLIQTLEKWLNIKL